MFCVHISSQKSEEVNPNHHPQWCTEDEVQLNFGICLFVFCLLSYELVCSIVAFNLWEIFHCRDYFHILSTCHFSPPKFLCFCVLVHLLLNEDRQWKRLTFAVPDVNASRIAMCTHSLSTPFRIVLFRLQFSSRH